MKLVTSCQFILGTVAVTTVILALLIVNADGCCKRQPNKTSWPSLKDMNNNFAQYMISCERQDIMIEVINADRVLPADDSGILKQLVVKIYVKSDGTVNGVPMVEPIVFEPVVELMGDPAGEPVLELAGDPFNPINNVELNTNRTNGEEETEDDSADIEDVK